jgi:hypothetical protein
MFVLGTLNRIPPAALKMKQWQTTGDRCVTIGGLFPKETSDEIENEFKDLAVMSVI